MKNSARSVSRRFSLFVSLALLAVLALPANAGAQVGAGLDPAAVRAAAKAIGTDTLKSAFLPPVDLTAYVNPGADAEEKLKVLGKALFWDQQVGSDGQACASCHFLAGADNRAKNQLDSGLRGIPPDAVYGNSRATFGDGYPQFGTNYTLIPADFPFHKLDDPGERNYLNRVVLQDTNDISSSQGVYTANFTGVVPGQLNDQGLPFIDPIFNVGNVGIRFVEPRNSPTVINAVFNVDNFWDGRAKSDFNGVSPLGPLDENATILVNGAAGLSEAKISIANSSLASQAVGPVLSTAEMSYVGRTFPDVGKKLLAARPLAFQNVSAADSVLGTYAITGNNTTGLSFINYAWLVQTVFQPEYWDSAAVITFNPDGSRVINPPGTAGGYTQMEANFSLFFGLAVQAYERTLVSDDTPFDRFMEGDDTALTQEQLRGLLVFINVGFPAQRANPLFAGVSISYCAGCHQGPEMTEAAFTTINKFGRIEIHSLVEMNAGLLTLNIGRQGFLDQGYSNVGVSPTSEDMGRGATEMGKPLSWTRARKDNLPFVTFPLPEQGELGEPRPPDNRDFVDGTFKQPGLRNVELTGPYMHNGSELTLADVVEFYDRHGNYGDKNPADIDQDLLEVNMNPVDEGPLVQFMLSLTDPRVRDEAAPFDHPQLLIPNGHPGDGNAITQSTTVNGVQVAADAMIELPAVGAAGRTAQGLPPVQGFLGVSQAPGAPVPPGPRPVAPYNLQLNGGWNLMSTPVLLDSRYNTLDTIIEPAAFGNAEVAYQWNALAGQWMEAEGEYIMRPLNAIYVKLSANTTATAGFIPSRVISTPPGLALTPGPNLVGTAPALVNGSFAAMPLDQALTSVSNNTTGGYTKVSCVASPGASNQFDWEYLPGSQGMPALSPFSGYWVQMANGDTLFGFSTTP